MDFDVEFAERLAESVINDCIIDHGDCVECMCCSSFGDYKEGIHHTSACIIPEAEAFLREIKAGNVK